MRIPSWLIVVIAGSILPSPFLARSARADAPPPLHQDFLRGDANQDGTVELSDVISTLSILFPAGTAPQILCEDALDFNDDENLDIGDPVYGLSYLFSGGETIPPPFDAGCGPDPTLNVALSCNLYEPCMNDTTIDLAAHALRRVGFGPTDERLDHVMTLGLDAYLTEQLHPELDDELDNVILQTLLTLIEPESDPFHLILMQIGMALFSRNQFREVAVDVWENHFNTYLPKSAQTLRNLRTDGGDPIYTPQEASAEATYWEYLENQGFRGNPFGTFSDLLVASATSPNMIVYLDGFRNRVGQPNENYARELLELHTMGVDNGYTQTDIEAVARCFTGWTIAWHALADLDDPLAPPAPYDTPGGWCLHFVPANHDYDSKVIFPLTSYQLDIPARTPLSSDGLLDGFEVLEHIANLSQTAEFVSTKWITRLIGDEPPPDLIAAAISTWLSTDGDIRAVLETVVTSEHFRAREYRWNKVEQPFEFLVSATRALGASTYGVPLIVGIDTEQTGLLASGQIPFYYETPEGQSEYGFDWLGGTSLLNRVLFATGLANSTDDPDPLIFPAMTAAGVDMTNVEAVADFWLKRLYQNGYDLDERQLAIDYLSRNGDGVPQPLGSDIAETRTRIRSFVGFLLSIPQANKQ